MKKKKIFNKTIYSILLISLFLGNSIGTAQALFGGGPSIPSTGEIIDTVEKHYGFDSNILRRSQRKGDYPQAEVFFDKTAPKEGEEVTATAMPKYFKNSNTELYYTWFLFRGEDDLGDDNAIEEAKQLAMGIAARGDFNPILFETDYSVDDNDLGAYDASYGGGDGRGGKECDDSDSGKPDCPSSIGSYESSYYVNPTSKQMVNTAMITRCYRHNFGFSNPENYSGSISTGGDLIVECEHKFPKAPKGEKFTDPLNVDGDELECDDDYEVGDGEFTTKEALCWQLDPENPDTDGDGFVDEADLAGLGQQQLTWTYQSGDRVGVIIEGTSMVSTNEAGSSPQSLVNTITYNCSSASDGSYCVDNASLEVGECIGGSCVSNSCSDPSDAGKPCELSGGGTGICGTGGMGVCEPVSLCSALTSSDGDLCEESGIQGTCLDSECVISRCGSEGDKCQTDAGLVGYCDTVGSCQETIAGASDSSVNPYYKIAWAGLDVCDKEQVEGDDKRNLIKNDECGGDDDYGFPYLATQKVSEAAENILKPNLIGNISQAQVNTENFGYSDYVIVKAVFNEDEGVDPDFLDYEWKIAITDEDDSPISSTFSHTEITSVDWVEGDLVEGLGATEIKIRGKKGSDFETLFPTAEKLYYYISLEVDYGGKNQIATLKVPIVVNDVEIEFLDQAGNLICNDMEEVYGKICPVYPGQLLFAASNASSVDGFSWELNGGKLSNKDSVYSPPFSSYETYSVIPVTGSDMSLQTVTLKAKKDNGDDITSERLISVAKPMAKISSQLDTAWPVIVEDGSTEGAESENVFGFSVGEDLSFKADLIPNYLSGYLTEHNIDLKWYINNQEVDSDFVTNNPDNNIDITSSPEELKFKLLGNEVDSINLKLEVIKTYTDTEKENLKEAWGITNVKDQTFQKTITLKKNLEAPSTVVIEGNSISIFMASTLKNAPEYFVFIIKTAIVFVLFWSLLFGFNYWFSQEVRLKESND